MNLINGTVYTDRNKKKYLLFFLIVFFMLFYLACSDETNSETETNIFENDLEPLKELGAFGKTYEADKNLNKDEWIAHITKNDKMEVYKPEQFIEDANILILSNMEPGEAMLKIDNPTLKNNLVWDIVSTKLLYREAKDDFKMLDTNYKEQTIKIMKNEAKTQYMILREINVPIKSYEPTDEDKRKFYKEREEVYTKMGIKNYTEIVDLEREYNRYYVKKLNNRQVSILKEKYDYETDKDILNKLKEMKTVDEILNSEYVDETILKINDKDISVEDFARYLLVKLTMINAKSMKATLLTARSLEMEIDTIIQQFIRYHLYLGKYKSKDYDEENHLKRFVNIYVESRIADVFIRKEVDNRVPRPLPTEVEEYYKNHEVSIKNYFWKHYSDIAVDMSEEEIEEYIRFSVAEMVYHNELIKEEQRRFRNHILELYNYKSNKELLETDILKEVPFKSSLAKNPLKLYKELKN